MYVTHLACKGNFGVQPIYYGLTSKFQGWFYDGKVVYLSRTFETRSEAQAAAEKLRADRMLR